MVQLADRLHLSPLALQEVWPMNHETKAAPRRSPWARPTKARSALTVAALLAA